MPQVQMSFIWGFCLKFVKGDGNVQSCSGGMRSKLGSGVESRDSKWRESIIGSTYGCQALPSLRGPISHPIIS